MNPAGEVRPERSTSPATRLLWPSSDERALTPVLRHPDLEVIVQDRKRHPAENANSAKWPPWNASVISRGYTLTKHASDRAGPFSKSGASVARGLSRRQPRQNPSGACLGAYNSGTKLSPDIPGRSAGRPSPACSHRQTHAHHAAAQKSACPYAVAWSEHASHLEDRIVHLQ